MAADGSRDVDRNALSYWGYLIKPNKIPTPRLTALLRGIATCISNHFSPHDSHDLTPSQLSAFYKAVGGNYDAFFLDLPPQSVAFIYKSLGCLHSLQPVSISNGFTDPEVPAMKHAGFVTWQTIQILLDPAEHAPFIQNALKMFNVIDPATGTPFPKVLPREAFPPYPDREMLEWHEQVGERLRAEADDSTAIEPSTSAESSADERADAANFFSDPQFKNREGKPGLVRNITNKVPKNVKHGGTMVMHTMRNIVDPHLWSEKKSLSERPHYPEHDGDRRLRVRRSPRRSSGRNSPDSRSRSRDSPRSRSRRDRSTDSERSLSPRESRRNRSQDPPSSPKDMFGNRNDRRSRSISHRRQVSNGSNITDSSAATEAPPFGAIRGSQSQQSNYPRQDRPAMSYRNSGGSANQMPGGRRVSDIPEVMVEDANRRESAPAGPPPLRQLSTRDPRRTSHSPRQTTPVNGVGGRRYTTNTPWRVNE